MTAIAFSVRKINCIYRSCLKYYEISQELKEKREKNISGPKEKVLM
jgi:hypothetical protein